MVPWVVFWMSVAFCAVSSATFLCAYLSQGKPRQIVMALLMLAVTASLVAWYLSLPTAAGQRPPRPMSSRWQNWGKATCLVLPSGVQLPTGAFSLPGVCNESPCNKTNAG